MVLLELFSGIGGFSMGLQAAGYSFEKVFFSEIEKHAIANFKYNFPYAEHIGSVTDIAKVGIARPDIITFGSPCQNFSVVGDGTGLRGEASSLVRYAIEAVGKFRPDVFIWENVKGILFARLSFQPYFMEQKNPSAAAVELNTMRLMEDRPARFVVTEKATGKKVFDINLTDFLILTSMEGNKMKPQEYLDREDEYKIIFFFSDSTAWNAVQININGWTWYIQNEED